MNLIVDFGNTRIKAALFDGDEMTLQQTFDSSETFVSALPAFHQAEKAFIGSVTKDHDLILELLEKKMKVEIFTAQTRVPLKNLYQSASTLGSDRLAASAGGFSLYPSQNVLVIDAGTCVKYNFTNDRNEYLGGAIAPGLQMRFKALNHFTQRLPLIAFKDDFDTLIGTNTEGSLLSGVINGILYETDGFISDYKKSYPDLRVIFTGGDTAFFAKRLKNSIFAHPELVLKGLNTILNYNS